MSTSTKAGAPAMSRRSLEDRARRIVEYYNRVNKDKKRVIEHFEEEGICKRTISKIIRRHEEKGDVTFMKPPGRRGTICTPEMFDRVANLFKENPNLPSGEAAKQLGIARTTIFRVLAKMREKNIETYKIVETRCPTCHQKCDPKVLLKKIGRPKKEKQVKSQPKKEESDQFDDARDKA